jgi:hypothetical protein
LIDVKRDEQHYMLSRDELYVHAIHKHLSQIKNIVLTQNSAASAPVISAIEAYQTAFTNYAATQHDIGIGKDSGLQGRVYRAAEAVEPMIRQIHSKAVHTGETAWHNFLGVISLIWAAGLGLGEYFSIFTPVPSRVPSSN